MLSKPAGWVGGESDVGFEGVVGVEGAEEVAVVVFGGFVFFVCDLFVVVVGGG